MPHLVKTFYNDDNTPYHKDGVKSLLCKIPVLFKFHTFALTSIQWSASRTEGRIIGFGVSLLAYRTWSSAGTGDTGSRTILPIPNRPLSTFSKASTLHLNCLSS